MTNKHIWTPNYEERNADYRRWDQTLYACVSKLVPQKFGECTAHQIDDLATHVYLHFVSRRNQDPFLKLENDREGLMPLVEKELDALKALPHLRELATGKSGPEAIRSLKGQHFYIDRTDLPAIAEGSRQWYKERGLEMAETGGALGGAPETALFHAYLRQFLEECLTLEEIVIFDEVMEGFIAGRDSGVSPEEYYPQMKEKMESFIRALSPKKAEMVQWIFTSIYHYTLRLFAQHGQVNTVKKGEPDPDEYLGISLANQFTAPVDREDSLSLSHNFTRLRILSGEIYKAVKAVVEKGG